MDPALALRLAFLKYFVIEGKLLIEFSLLLWDKRLIGCLKEFIVKYHEVFGPFFVTFSTPFYKDSKQNLDID